MESLVMQCSIHHNRRPNRSESDLADRKVFFFSPLLSLVMAMLLVMRGADFLAFIVTVILSSAVALNGCAAIIQWDE